MDVDQTKILTLAEQGNLQAIAVVLNRHLMSKGAHIKVKQKADCLQILLHTPQNAQQTELVKMLRNKLLALHPSGFQTIKVYNPQPGKNTASLIYEFNLSSPGGSSQGSLRPTIPPFAAAKREDPPPTQRSSVAEVLLQMSSLEDLKVLKNHPFFTGKCPQCNSPYIKQDPPPVFWDCPQCGWVDDPIRLTPNAKNHPSSAKTIADSKQLGKYLMEAGLLTQSQLEVALADQQITGMRLGEVLVRRGWVKEETIEYLMQKVILPERSFSQAQSSSYVELSRKLLKTLMNQAGTASPLSDHSQGQRNTDKSGHVVSERATLVLPDADVNDYLDDF
ncbi:MAG: hypothetical protein HC934_06475 [Acaryochloridaceae cyanobacterium SU_2_1]|nr:hypothetical protein [Acaryochloridaceae cyanobacterium SU_2_1]